MGLAFSKGPGLAFPEVPNPVLGPGPLYKECLFLKLFVLFLKYRPMHNALKQFIKQMGSV